ncbi:hypothetical protein [Dactylosporangium sp. NPDC049140]|uniref:hypothetical protein n=1 Tax=Dactylosporangium sp. NPDC049140 TaxID=3155647 RepID=UPI0033DF754C
MARRIAAAITGCATQQARWVAVALCHWILEVHLVDRCRGFGGFYEQLLDLQHAGA